MNNKLLTEYCGLCWHTVKECMHPVLFVRMNRCTCGRDIDTHLCVNPDFSTPEGYELLHKAIGEKSGWDSIYRWRKMLMEWPTKNSAGVDFHELPCAEKSQIISDWLEARL